MPKTAPSKKAAASSKKASASSEKPEKKSAKAAAPIEEELVNPPEGEPQVDLEELEEQEEEAAAAGSQGGNAAALAAASSTNEMSASFKNFRHHPDMENFYRFIFENDLRQEALAIIDQIMVEKQQRRLMKGAPKTSSH